MENNVAEYLKLGRLEFAGFLFITILTGALCIKGYSLRIIETLPIFILAVSTNLWGFAHNDYTDIENDKSSVDLNERPLVKGSVSKSGTLIMIIVCVVINIITIFYSSTYYAVIIAVISTFFAFAYNLNSKKIPGSDLLFASSTALLVFLGGMIVSAHTNFTFLFYTVIVIIFLENLIFNAGASLKDVKNDLENNSVTAAIFFKVRIEKGNRLIIPSAFKIVIISLKLLSLIIIAISCYYSQIGFSHTQTVILFIVCICSLIVTIKAVSLETFDRQLIGENWIRHEAVTKLIIPIMLYSHIGLFWTIFIIFIPFLWFFLSTIILYKKSFVLHNGF
ncbi:MAG: UbiA family prenyltransferase [Desulfobacteraceae bacterium]|nr:UbiA family prenyltransferase [Desulfobacteraceae bacterium]